MQKVLMLLPVVVAVLFWAGYHYHKDRHLPEPPLNLLIAFLLGAAASWISLGLYAALEPIGWRLDAVTLGSENPTLLLVYSLLAIGPIEEFSKLLPFLIVVLRFRDFDEPLDGLIYGSFLGLGYAAVENLNYLDFLTPLEAAARSFAGPVVHILFASIWAHWITGARLAGRSILLPATIGFLISASLHGLYDFLVLLRPVTALPAAALLIIAIWVWRLFLMRRMHDEAVRESIPENRTEN